MGESKKGEKGSRDCQAALGVICIKVIGRSPSIGGVGGTMGEDIEVGRRGSQGGDRELQS